MIPVVIIQTIVLAITAFIVWRYTKETHLLRKSAEGQTELFRQAEIFNSLTRIHERLYTGESCVSRGFLRQRFSRALVSATQERFKSTYGPNHGGVGMPEGFLENILSELKEDYNSVRKFNSSLQGRDNALIHAERVLADFEVIAFPFVLKNPIIRVVAEQYKPLLAQTTQYLLPFVAIQRRLRGKQDPGYAEPYLQLLQGLGIDTYNVSKILSETPSMG